MRAFVALVTNERQKHKRRRLLMLFLQMVYWKKERGNHMVTICGFLPKETTKKGIQHVIYLISPVTKEVCRLYQIPRNTKVTHSSATASKTATLRSRREHLML